jgi:hypothetical protein
MMDVWWSVISHRAICRESEWRAFVAFRPAATSGYSEAKTMGQIVKGLFGGGDDSAKKAAEESRQTQRVANDRQLAESNRNSQAIGATRRAPKGRRLFEDGPASASTVLG